MDGLFALVALIVLGVPIGIILLWIGQAGLKARVATLEAEVTRLRRDPQGDHIFQVTAPESDDGPPPQTTAEQGPEPLPEGAASPWQRGTAQVGRVVPDTAAATGPDTQNRPLVITALRARALVDWLRTNWVYAVSALSLALAGVFFVQYGVEKGLLPPAVRVALAILFGAGLIVAGEWLRRKQAVGIWAATTFLPAVFAGAGLVSIFAGIVAGRQMYALYGHQAGFAGLVLTAALAVALGWRHGPLLAVIGLLGAAAAPFLVAGPGGAAPWLYGYFTLIAAVGLSVDALRRWAWVSVLALGLGYGCGFVIFGAGGGAVGWVLALVGLAVLATVVPLLQLVPFHPGPSVLQSLIGKGRDWPVFPVRISAGAALASGLGLLALKGQVPAESLVAFAALALLALIWLLWARYAPGLADLAALPAAAFLLRLIVEVTSYGPLAGEFAGQATVLRAPETAAPWTASGLLVLAALISGAAALRAFQAGPGRLGVAFGLGAALVAPLAAAVLEFFWHPGVVLGPYPWALHVMALAALMAGLALRFAALDGIVRRRAAHATLSALALIALALFLITTKAALTLALAVLVVAAAWLDRRFRLPEMAGSCNWAWWSWAGGWLSPRG